MYGRLADPDCTLGTDPRMVKALAQFGFDGRLPGPDVSVDAPLAERLAAIAEIEDGMGGWCVRAVQRLDGS